MAAAIGLLLLSGIVGAGTRVGGDEPSAVADGAATPAPPPASGAPAVSPPAPGTAPTEVTPVTASPPPPTAQPPPTAPPTAPTTAPTTAPPPPPAPDPAADQARARRAIFTAADLPGFTPRPPPSGTGGGDAEDPCATSDPSTDKATAEASDDGFTAEDGSFASSYARIVADVAIAAATFDFYVSDAGVACYGEVLAGDMADPGAGESIELLDAEQAVLPGTGDEATVVLYRFRVTDDLGTYDTFTSSVTIRVERAVADFVLISLEPVPDEDVLVLAQRVAGRLGP